MRAAVLIILAIALTALVESSPGSERRPAPYVNRLPPPKTRYARSPNPEPQGSLSVTAQRSQIPGQNWQTNAAVQGSYRFPESNPRGSISANWQKSFNGPERRPSYGLGYEHTIFQNRHGSIGVSAGAQRFPGQNWQPNVGIGGRFRFRRSVEPDFEEVQVDQQE